MVMTVFRLYLSLLKEELYMKISKIPKFKRENMWTFSLMNKRWKLNKPYLKILVRSNSWFVDYMYLDSLLSYQNSLNLASGTCRWTPQFSVAQYMGSAQSTLLCLPGMQHSLGLLHLNQQNLIAWVTGDSVQLYMKFFTILHLLRFSTKALQFLVF